MSEREKALPLTPEQVRTLQETGSVEMWDEMKPGQGTWSAMVSGWTPYPIGTQAWVQEEWYCDHCFAGNYEMTARLAHRFRSRAEIEGEWRGVIGDGCPYGDMMYYHADGEIDEQMPERDSEGEPFEWESPQAMPQWASRFNVISTAVRVERRDGVWGFVTTWRKA